MRVRFRERQLRRHRRSVRPERHPRQANLLEDVVLRHHEIDRAHARPILEHQIHDRVGHLFAAQFRHFRKRLAGQRLQRVGFELDEQHAIGRTRGEIEIFPGRRRRHDRVRDLLSRRGVLQPLVGLLVAAVEDPGRHRGVESRRARRIVVHVRRDPQAFTSRAFDRGDRSVHLGPIRLAGGLEVIDLRRDARLAADAHELADRFEQPVAFASHVRDVLPAVLRGFPAQRDELVGRRVERRRVDERGADAERALFHPLPHQRAHLVELLGSRLPVFEADHVLAYRGRAKERGDVRRDAALLQLPQVLRQRGPGDLVLDVAHLLDQASFMRSLSGPIELPSPKISSVTPWRMSLCERPSTSSDSVAHESMLMKPGATARFVASIVTRALAVPRLPMLAIRSPLIATSTTRPGLPEPSYTVPFRMMVSNAGACSAGSGEAQAAQAIATATARRDLMLGE